jgi:hypothetical protein
MDLAILNDLDGWRDTWGSTWLFEFGTPDDQIRKLDPPNGLERWRNPVQDDAYRTQTYKAIWTTAKLAAMDLVAHLDMSSLPPVGQQILTSLIVYLFVTGAVNFQAGGTSTRKNYLPQLPKTSPASIARTIAAMWLASTAMLQSLNLAGDRAVQTWANFAPRVRQSPQLPAGGPCEGAASY